MKLSRLLGLAALTVLATMAFALAPSASATELCDAEEDPCAEENVYAGGTTIKASSTKAVFETNAGNVTCEESAAEGRTFAEAADPLSGEVSLLTFGKCKSSIFGTSCTVTAVNLPYAASIEDTGADVGTITLGEGDTGPPGGTVVCSGLINCEITAESVVLGAKGGSPGLIVASKEPFSKLSGSCPETASWTATYNVDAPKPVHFAERLTKLCTVVPEEDGRKCPTGKAYKGQINANVPGTKEVKIISLGTPTGEVQCKEGKIVGNFEEDGSGEVTSMKFSTGGGSCTSTFSGTPAVAVSVLNLAAKGSSFIFRRAQLWPEGLFSVFGGNKIIKLELVRAGQTPCVYLMNWVVFQAFNPSGGTTMTAFVHQWKSVRLEGPSTICPPEVEVKAPWLFETGGSEMFWIAEK